MKPVNLININDFTPQEIEAVLSLAQQIIKRPKDFSHLCDGKILGTLFFEPSTRTRLSFESAMNRLGGSVIGISESGSSSTTKGETLGDTIHTVSCYTDIIAMRHPLEGSATLASQHATVPLINAGDGGHQHPTQTLTDLLTIKQVKNDLDHQVIGLCGDLKFGRTVHSLIKAMSAYPNNHFVLISPEELQVPDYIKNYLDQKNISYEEVERIEDSMKRLDILYMTRVQKERFFNEADYVRLKDSYILDKEKLKAAKADLAILHPLPRVNEIHPEVDSDPRAVYFDQVHYGVIVRMALILTLLDMEVPTC